MKLPLPLTLVALGCATPFVLGFAPATIAPQETAEEAAPTYEVKRVVDGDTIHILRDGETVKLRLLSVDTEEKITGRPNLSPTKPETLYGQECTEWAQAFFDDLAEGDAAPRVSLAFPDGREESDIYGRLLCHVILPDGTDFNLLLVQTGRSPYFNKYGNSRICHEAFVKAQAEAREKQLGIWNPATNTPEEEGDPAAKRPYDQLLPWWQARADAIDAYRAAHAADPTGVVAADDPAALGAAFAKQGGKVRVFGSIDRFFDEDDGSLTVLFRSPSKTDAFRAVVPPPARAGLEDLDLRGTTGEFRQNFLYVEGRLYRGPRGWQMVAAKPEQWAVAEPSSAAPVEAGAGGR